MTYYIQYRAQMLTCHWRPDGTLAVRLQRLRHAGEALIVGIGDCLLITNKRGKSQWTCRVQAFVPHMRYGTFVRSGHVICRNVECFTEAAMEKRQ
jgi:hypothetical protein